MAQAAIHLHPSASHLLRPGATAPVATPPTLRVTKAAVPAADAEAIAPLPVEPIAGGAGASPKALSRSASTPVGAGTTSGPIPPPWCCGSSSSANMTAAKSSAAIAIAALALAAASCRTVELSLPDAHRALAASHLTRHHPYISNTRAPQAYARSRRGGSLAASLAEPRSLTARQADGRLVRYNPAQHYASNACAAVHC